MARILDYYIKQAERMITDDRDRDTIFQKYANAWHCDWDMPAEFSRLQGAYKQIDTDPHDAISTADRVLTGKFPTLRLTPWAETTENKVKANDWEINLKWQLMSCNRRRPNSVQSDMLRSALTYGVIVTQVIDLDAQIDQLKKLKRDSFTWEMLRRYSRFVVKTYNPQNVHVRYSSYMPVAILIHEKRTPQSILDDFPDTKGLDVDAKDPVDYYEYWDLKSRAIWVNDEVTVLPPTDHGLTFFPFVCMMGGSTLETKAKDAYHPLLYSVIKSGQWEASNTFKSMASTDAMWNFARNRFAQEGTNPEVTQIDAVAPNQVAVVPPGDMLKPLPYPQPDPAIESIMAGLTSGIQKSTVSSVLQGAGEGLGTAAFATLNLMTLTAVGALKPWRELTEKALAELYFLFLMWARYTEKDIVAYGKDKKDAGRAYVIPWNEIDDELYLEVTLAPDLPTNKQAQAMTAIQLKSAGLLDDETALEEMGYENPQAIIENITLQQMVQNNIALFLQQKQMALEMQAQQAAQGQQAAAEQQMAEQQQAQQMQQMYAQGGMTNAGEGGIPRAMVAPAETRESITGVAANGVPLATEALP
jgi:hypothetical protein